MLQRTVAEAAIRASRGIFAGEGRLGGRSANSLRLRQWLLSLVCANLCGYDREQER